MVEQDVKDKYILIAKLNQEIDGLTRRKSDLEKVVSDAEKYASNKRSSADEYLHLGKKCLEECRAERTKLDNEIIDFNANKVVFEGDIKRLRNEANSIMAQANEKQKELSDREINITIKESSQNRRQSEIEIMSARIIQDRAKIDADRQDLVTREWALTKESDELKALKETNEQILSDMKELSMKSEENDKKGKHVRK